MEYENNQGSAGNVDNSNKQDGNTQTGAQVSDETVSKKEFERRVNSLTAKTKTFESENAELRERLAAFEKEKEEKSFTQMTTEQREKVEFDKAREKFEAERQEFERNKLAADISADLTEKGLPKSFAKVLALVGDNDEIVTLLDEAVVEQQEILKANLKQQLAGKAPTRTATGSSSVTKEQFAKMTYAERTDLYANNKALYQQLSQ